MESEIISLQNFGESTSQQNTNKTYVFLKRFFDFVFSLIILVMCSPLFLFISLGILLSSRGKIFYTQFRLGRGGKIFRCYKFRTMHCDAEKRLKDLLANDPCLLQEWTVKQKLKQDPRVFRFGKFLRKTSLDELPQFWNVIKGDLSVVGPRPYMIKQKKELGPFLHKILCIRPGITGLWQTSGRSKTTFKERIILDAIYVDKHTFWLDCILVLKTVWIIFFPRDTAS